MKLKEVQRLYEANDDVTEETFDSEEPMSLEDFEEDDIFLTPCELTEIIAEYTHD